VIEIQLKKFRDRLLLKMFIRQQAALNCELMEYSVVEAKRRGICPPQKSVKPSQHGSAKLISRIARLTA
jgi:hypothetical protein